MPRRTFQRLGEQAATATEKTLYRKALEIMHRSDELVPIDTGTLRASGRVLPPETTAAGVTVTCGYGYGQEYAAKATAEAEASKDENSPGYGVFVHERVELRHEPPRQAKFLETAGAELLPSIPADVAVEIRKSWKPGAGAGQYVEELR